MNKEEDGTFISMKEYHELLDYRKWALALVSAGVDNWDGYDYAQELYQESE